MLDSVKERLSQVGIRGITISEVRGFGRQKAREMHRRGSGSSSEFIPKIKVRIASPDSVADEIVGELLRAARTGEIGDGKIFVHPLESVIRIRTGETGETATFLDPSRGPE